MPVLENSIGVAEFQDLVGTVYPRQMQIELIDRPGTNSIGARNTGTKGKPFRLVSTAYHDSFDAASQFLIDCTTLKDSLQILVMNGTLLGSVMVVEVAEHKPRQAVYNVAGAPGKQCRAELAWTLILMG